MNTRKPSSVITRGLKFTLVDESLGDTAPRCSLCSGFAASPLVQTCAGNDSYICYICHQDTKTCPLCHSPDCLKPPTGQVSISVNCPSSKCPVKAPLFTIHRHLSRCMHAPVACSSCGEVVSSRRELGSHLSRACTRRARECEVCKQRIPVDDMDAHMKQSHPACLACGGRLLGPEDQTHCEMTCIAQQCVERVTRCTLVQHIQGTPGDVGSLVAEVEELRADADVSREELAELREHLSSLNPAEAAARKAELVTLRSDVVRHSERVAVLDDENESLREVISSLEEEVLMLKQSLKDQTEQVEKHRTLGKARASGDHGSDTSYTSSTSSSATIGPGDLYNGSSSESITDSDSDSDSDANPNTEPDDQIDARFRSAQLPAADGVPSGRVGEWVIFRRGENLYFVSTVSPDACVVELIRTSNGWWRFKTNRGQFIAWSNRDIDEQDLADYALPGFDQQPVNPGVYRWGQWVVRVAGDRVVVNYPTETSFEMLNGGALRYGDRQIGVNFTN